MIELVVNQVVKILIMISYVINMYGHAKGGGAFGASIGYFSLLICFVHNATLSKA